MAPDGKFKKVRLSTNPSEEDLRALQLGDVVYLMPPLVIGADQLSLLTGAIYDVVSTLP